MKDEGLITFVSEVSESELFCPASFILNPSSDKLFSLLSFIFQRSGLSARSAVFYISISYRCRDGDEDDPHGAEACKPDKERGSDGDEGGEPSDFRRACHL